MTKKTDKRKIPLVDLTVSDEAKRQVNQSLQSGWLTSGPKVKEFETAFARRCGVRYAAAVNSSTAGLQITLATLGVAGKEVLTSPFTFVATIEAIIAAGGTPEFVDIDPHTLNIDSDEVFRKVTDRTAAILAVDLAGLPCDYTPIKKICEHYKIPLISDSAQSFGSLYKKKAVPCHADVSVFSLHSTKNLTCGEGGMVVSRHKPVIEKIKLLSNHALTATSYDKKKKQSAAYDVIDYGFKANMSDLHAAVGLGQLSVFDKEQAKRLKVVDKYLANLSGLDDLIELPLEDKKYKSNRHLFIIKLHLSKLRIDRNRFIRLMAQQGIECGVHYPPVYDLSFYRDHFGDLSQYFPNTTYAGRRVVSLPLYAGLNLSDVDYICEVIVDLLSKHQR